LILGVKAMTLAEKQIVEKVKVLSPKERDEVLQYVNNILSKQRQQSVSKNADANDSSSIQLEWLKANRDRYAGKYVALDGDVLVAHAENLQEIRLKTRGKTNLFIVKVFAEETIVSAGL
jgi:Family of unknown function (DUF5678)